MQEARGVAPGLVADLDAAGAVVGLDIDGATRTLDLSTVEAVAASPPPGRPA